MTDQELEPMNEEGRRLLEEERAAPPPSPHLKDALWNGLVARLDLPFDPAHPHGRPGLAAEVPSAPAAVLRGKLLVGAVALFLVGGAVGGGIVRALDHARGSNAAAAPAPSAEPKASAAPSTGSVAPSGTAATTPTPRVLPKPSVPAAVDLKMASPLKAERALIDAAHTALSRGNAEAALPSLERHERMFPAGQLTEERELLWIQALVSTGRAADAQARAEEFRRLFPRSLLLSSVEEALSVLSVTDSGVVGK